MPRFRVRSRYRPQQTWTKRRWTRVKSLRSENVESTGISREKPTSGRSKRGFFCLFRYIFFLATSRKTDGPCASSPVVRGGRARVKITQTIASARFTTDGVASCKTVPIVYLYCVCTARPWQSRSPWQQHFHLTVVVDLQVRETRYNIIIVYYLCSHTIYLYTLSSLRVYLFVTASACVTPPPPIAVTSYRAGIPRLRGVRWRIRAQRTVGEQHAFSTPVARVRTVIILLLLLSTSWNIRLVIPRVCRWPIRCFDEAPFFHFLFFPGAAMTISLRLPSSGSAAPRRSLPPDNSNYFCTSTIIT